MKECRKGSSGWELCVYSTARISFVWLILVDERHCYGYTVFHEPENQPNCRTWHSSSTAAHRMWWDHFGSCLIINIGIDIDMCYQQQHRQRNPVACALWSSKHQLRPPETAVVSEDITVRPVTWQ